LSEGRAQSGFIPGDVYSQRSKGEEAEYRILQYATTLSKTEPYFSDFNQL
jgi:hypothetical protein